MHSISAVVDEAENPICGEACFAAAASTCSTPEFLSPSSQPERRPLAQLNPEIFWHWQWQRGAGRALSSR